MTSSLASGTAPYEYVEWLSGDAHVAYRDYWEDEAQERTKPYWILDGDFGKLERYLESAGRIRQIERAVRAVRDQLRMEVGGVGCELGAGVAWAVPHLLRQGPVERIYCVEYSRHRLRDIAPALLRHYGIEGERVVLALGDFNSLRLPDGSMDFVFMCATLHHTDDPRGLLKEVARILRDGGVVIVTGEHEVRLTWTQYIRHPAKWLAARILPKSLQRRWRGHEIRARRFLPTLTELLETDEILGDHYYTPDEYAALFSEAGFGHVRIPDEPSREQSFLLTRSGE